MKFIYLFIFICLFSFVSAGLDIGYDLENSVNNVVLNIPETPINYSLIPTVNSSDYWDNRDTPADITYDEISGGDVNALGYTGTFNFIASVVGTLSMNGDPWYLGGTDLEIAENLDVNKDLNVDGDSNLNNTYPQATLTSSLGSGALRWLNLFVQNINAEEIDAFNLILSNNLTVGGNATIDGLINGVNISNLSNEFVPYNGATNNLNMSVYNITANNLFIGDGERIMWDGGASGYIEASSSSGNLDIHGGNIRLLGNGDINIGTGVSNVDFTGDGSVPTLVNKLNLPNDESICWGDPLGSPFCITGNDVGYLSTTGYINSNDGTYAGTLGNGAGGSFVDVVNSVYLADGTNAITATGNVNVTGNVTADNFCIGSVCSDEFGNSSWNESYSDTLYYGIDNSFSYYNSTTLDLSGYAQLDKNVTFENITSSGNVLINPTQTGKIAFDIVPSEAGAYNKDVTFRLSGYGADAGEYLTIDHDSASNFYLKTTDNLIYLDDGKSAFTMYSGGILFSDNKDLRAGQDGNGQHATWGYHTPTSGTYEWGVIGVSSGDYGFNSSRIMQFCEIGDRNYNFQSPASKYPKFIFQSPDQVTDQWMSIGHDGSEMVFNISTGTYHFYGANLTVQGINYETPSIEKVSTLSLDSMEDPSTFTKDNKTEEEFHLEFPKEIQTVIQVKDNSNCWIEDLGFQYCSDYGEDTEMCQLKIPKDMKGWIKIPNIETRCGTINKTVISGGDGWLANYKLIYELKEKNTLLENQLADLTSRIEALENPLGVIK